MALRAAGGIEAVRRWREVTALWRAETIIRITREVRAALVSIRDAGREVRAVERRAGRITPGYNSPLGIRAREAMAAAMARLLTALDR